MPLLGSFGAGAARGLGLTSGGGPVCITYDFFVVSGGGGAVKGYGGGGGGGSNPPAPGAGGGSGVVVIREQAVDSAPGVWDLKTVYFYKTGTGWPS